MKVIAGKSKKIRNIIATSWLVMISFVVIMIFWYNEYQYSLPTPVPVNYHSVSLGKKIDLGQKIEFSNNKPVLLHFFNPDCPCSKFNIKHLRTLVKQYGGKMNFAVVLMTNKPYTAAEIKKKMELNIPVLSDKTIAKACGVYSTPQAAILDSNHRLYYRGNYNRSRYCSDEKTEYARIAIVNLLQQKQLQSLSRFALQAYGCTLPNCGKY